VNSQCSGSFTFKCGSGYLDPKSGAADPLDPIYGCKLLRKVVKREGDKGKLNWIKFDIMYHLSIMIVSWPILRVRFSILDPHNWDRIQDVILKVHKRENFFGADFGFIS